MSSVISQAPFLSVIVPIGMGTTSLGNPDTVNGVCFICPAWLALVLGGVLGLVNYGLNSYGNLYKLAGLINGCDNRPSSFLSVCHHHHHHYHHHPLRTFVKNMIAYGIVDAQRLIILLFPKRLYCIYCIYTIYTFVYIEICIF